MQRTRRTIESIMNSYLVLNRGDILFRQPMEGDPVLYFFFNPRTKRYQTDVGLIAREMCEDQWIITGTPRYKEQVLFVLSLEGYAKQKRLTNPLAV